MSDAERNLQSLREALEVSPDNVPLRRHLARSLVDCRRFDEAIDEFKKALSFASDDEELKLGLADAYHKAGRTSEALVILESLEAQARTPAPAYIMHARILLATGEVEDAVRKYKRALEVDPASEDPDLTSRLGVQPAPAASDEDEIEEIPFEVVDGRVRASHDEGGDGPLGEVERPDISFDDVGGMDRVKDEIRAKIIHPLEHPEIYEAYGKKVGGGILMYGPPGCGKTHLARATAGEVKASFLSVGLHDVLDMWIGQSERNLNAIFQQARENAPCVLFFDEVDALGASRTDMRQSAGRQLINQFLSELDGIHASNEGVLILAATNTPWHLDSAFRRPGRFDRIIFVTPPDEPARAEILRVMLNEKPVKEVDRAKVAKKTDGFSGADMKALVDMAVEAKLADAVKTGIPEPLTTKDLLAAAKPLKPTTKEWFATARNYALYSNQGGLYDNILDYLGIRK